MKADTPPLGWQDWNKFDGERLLRAGALCSALEVKSDDAERFYCRAINICFEKLGFDDGCLDDVALDSMAGLARLYLHRKHFGDIGNAMRLCEHAVNGKEVKMVSHNKLVVLMTGTSLFSYSIHAEICYGCQKCFKIHS